MHYLGTIVRLQLQRASLKRGERPAQTYDPSPLLVVDSLTLTPGGAVAYAPDGSCLLDIHHAAHPQTRQSKGKNPLSVGFTSHYAAMQRQFGEHMTLGCAAESIIVEGPAVPIPLSVVSPGLVIETAAGPIHLVRVVVAAPCAPFSRWTLRNPAATPEDLKPALQFLGDGLRGFYCAYDGPAAATITLGDKLYALPSP